MNDGQRGGFKTLAVLGNDRVFMPEHQRETAPSSPVQGQAIGFEDITVAVIRLQAAGFGFGAKGASPGAFYLFDEVKQRKDSYWKGSRVLGGAVTEGHDSETMRAIRLRAAGGASELVVEQIAKPRLQDGEALVRVHAAAVTRDELEWPVDRLPAIPSYELSGVVAAVAPGVDAVSVGEAVFALTLFDRDGVAVDYAAVPAELLAAKPRALDHVESATVPLPGLSADHPGCRSRRRRQLDRDYDPDGHIYELEHAAERIAAAAEAAQSLAFPFTLTARAEHHIRGNPDLDDTIARLRAFEQAGADVLYAPGLRTMQEIRAVCERSRSL